LKGAAGDGEGSEGAGAGGVGGAGGAGGAGGGTVGADLAHGASSSIVPQWASAQTNRATLLATVFAYGCALSGLVLCASTPLRVAMERADCDRALASCLWEASSPKLYFARAGGFLAPARCGLAEVTAVEASCHIRRLAAAALSRFRRVERLGLAWNELDTLPQEGLAPLRSMTSLNVAHNALRTLPPALAQLWDAAAVPAVAAAARAEGAMPASSAVSGARSRDPSSYYGYGSLREVEAAGNARLRWLHWGSAGGGANASAAAAAEAAALAQGQWHLQWQWHWGERSALRWHLPPAEAARDRGALAMGLLKGLGALTHVNVSGHGLCALDGWRFGKWHADLRMLDLR
jgi:hypothetical protein